MPEIPLFPLDMVLLPSCRVPLHIFEERYKLMVNSCVDTDSEFGIVWGQDDDHKDVGCAARVVDVVDRFPDGRMNIVVQGTERFRLIGRHEQAPFITGSIESLPDHEHEPDTTMAERVRQLYTEALKFTLGWFRPDDTEPIDAPALSYTVAASLGLPLERQQHLLETQDVNERLEEVLTMLEATLAGLHDAHKKTSGNGKA